MLHHHSLSILVLGATTAHPRTPQSALTARILPAMRAFRPSAQLQGFSAVAGLLSTSAVPSVSMHSVLAVPRLTPLPTNPSVQEAQSLLQELSVATRVLSLPAACAEPTRSDISVEELFAILGFSHAASVRFPAHACGSAAKQRALW